MSASKAKNNFGYLIEEVYVRRKSVIITKNNRPVAKVSPVYGYESAEASPALSLDDREYKEIKEGVGRFRKTFKFSF